MNVLVIFINLPSAQHFTPIDFSNRPILSQDSFLVMYLRSSLVVTAALGIYLANQAAFCIIATGRMNETRFLRLSA
jgi:hypothetical protein